MDTVTFNGKKKMEINTEYDKRTESSFHYREHQHIEKSRSVRTQVNLCPR